MDAAIDFLNTDSFRHHYRQVLDIEADIMLCDSVAVMSGNLPIHTEFFYHSDTAPLLFCVPGLGSYSEPYTKLFSALSKQGFSVVGIDLRGHGYSAGSRGFYSMDTCLQDIRAVVDHYTARYAGPALMFGYSIGALVALAYAESDPRVQAYAGFTLLVPDLPPAAMHRWGWNWISNTAQLVPGSTLPVSQLLPVETEALPLNMMRVLYQDPLRIHHYPMKTLASLYTHKLASLQHRFDFKGAILQAEHDRVLTPEYARSTQEALEHSFELIELDDETHYMAWSNPERLAQVAGDWYRKQVPA